MAQNPIVTIEMENGSLIKAELYPQVAPNSVNNFISLIQKGFYDGLIFHRCIPGFMIQGGCPQGTGTGGPGYSIKGEFAQNGFANDLVHDRGVLSMARSMNPNSAGSQFFIMVDKAPHLDGGYAAFGKVIEGMETADAIVSGKTDWQDRPRQKQVMKKVTVDTFGVPRAQRSGSRSERRSGVMSELSASAGSEGYEARDDEGAYRFRRGHRSRNSERMRLTS